MIYLYQYMKGMPTWLKLLWVFLLFPFLSWADENVPIQSKKILVLSSNGGNGHNAAAGALKSILKDQYDFKVIYPIDDLQILGVSSGESVYNLALRNGWTRSVNVVSKYVAPKLFRTYKKKLEGLITQQIDDENPDLVISLIPFINFPASEAARKSDVPYLLITTDNDLQAFVHGLQGVSHPHFKVVIGNDLRSGHLMLKKRNIPDEAIESIGLPIRPDFLAKKDPLELRKHFQIPAYKPVILVMLGGAGNDAALDYAKTLGGVQLGVHLIVCAGKNQDLARKLRKVDLHPTNTMTVMEFTDKIPELMTLADLIITKPGTTSITESMFMRLPILVDCTTPVLDWEQANIDMVVKYGIGGYISQFEEAEKLVRHYLYDSEFRQEIQTAYQNIPVNRFNEEIASLIEEMCMLKKPELASR